MSSTFTANSGIEKPGTGEQSGNWGNTLNVGMDIIDSAISGSITITVSSQAHTLTTADGSAADGQNKSLIFTSSSDVGLDTTVTISPNNAEKIYFVKNSLAGSRNLVISQGTGANVTIANGKSSIVAADGGGSNAAVSNLLNDAQFNSIKLTSVLALTEGGTGGNTATAARTALGLGTSSTFNVGSSATNIVQLDANAKIPAINGSLLTNMTEAIVIAASDETTALEVGDIKVTFRMPYAFTLTAIRASLTTAPVGSTLIVDVLENRGTLLSTKISIDANEKTSTTAAAAPVISDSNLADDTEITIDIDQIGSSTAGAGLKVYLIGFRV